MSASKIKKAFKFTGTCLALAAGVAATLFAYNANAQQTAAGQTVKPEQIMKQPAKVMPKPMPAPSSKTIPFVASEGMQSTIIHTADVATDPSLSAQSVLSSFVLNFKNPTVTTVITTTKPIASAAEYPASKNLRPCLYM